MTVDLGSYDVVLLNTSAGKDSQAMMDHIYRLAVDQGVTERLVAVHCDLGRVEWPGTRELAAEQAAHYGLRFEVMTRRQGDLLVQIEARGMWPSSQARYCTSDQKRAQVRRLMTQLVDERWQGKGSRVRILNCMGIRAEESAPRAKRVPFVFDESASNGKRHVDEYLPIFTWKLEEVWGLIRRSGVRWHYAYDLGMPRLSCALCIFAPFKALLIAGYHNRELLEYYVALEEKMGHTFRKGFRIAEVREALDSGVVPQGVVTEWAQCA